MDDRVTENFQSYEPEPAYDWDYDDEPRHAPKVLWGRVAILGAALLVVFLIGRATGGDSGVPKEQLAAARAEISDLQAQVTDLEDQLAAVPEATPTVPADTTTTDGNTTDTTTVEGETYTVKSGDTLRGIAQTFCGDAQFDDVIMEANDITDPTQLSVGAEIVIPADCGK
jgi:nucleoid-associated protein YgaU